MFGEALLLLAALALPLFLFLRRRGSRASSLRCGELIPGPPALPLLGNVLDLPTTPKNLIQYADAYRRKYGHLYRLWVGPSKLCVVLGNAQDAEMLLSNTRNVTKSIQYDFARSWLGKGLIISSGSTWRKHRKIITPAFHIKILETFVTTFDKEGDILISQLKTKEMGKPFDIFPLIDVCSQDIICGTAMGFELNAQREGHGLSYVKGIQEMCDVIICRSIRPWLFPDFLYRLSPLSRKEQKSLKVIHGMVNDVVSKRRKEIQIDTNRTENVDEEGRKRKSAFLDHLLISERSKLLTEEDIRDEVHTFMFAGHDTTASAISFALMELSKNADIQNKVYQELKEIASDNSNNLSLSLQTLNELKYLEKVIKETLRLYPSVPIFARDLTEDLQLATMNVTLPPGVIAVVDPSAVHRHPDYYPDPEKFDPENFSSEAILKRHPYAYLPFSAGPRNCIGQKFALLEAKAIVAKIIWNFFLQIEPNFELRLLGEITLKSQHGIRISLDPRTHE